jgi:hypothetical protein
MTVHPAALAERAMSTIAKNLKVPRPEIWRIRPDIYDPTTGAVYEIKPSSRLFEGMTEANTYVSEINKLVPGAAHLGASAFAPESVGTSGSFDFLIYHVRYSAPVDGVITYDTSYVNLCGCK